jgi:hypothetical protein
MKEWFVALGLSLFVVWFLAGILSHKWEIKVELVSPKNKTPTTSLLLFVIAWKKGRLAVYILGVGIHFVKKHLRD